MQSLTKSLQNSRTPVQSTDERVRMLQRKLYLKAKQDKAFKFYVLYDKVRLDYFLWEAYRRVKANGGAPGIDGITFKEIEEADLPEFINQLKEDLTNKTYKAQAVRRVCIPKANGKTRPLGIPTIRDRVVQMSCKMAIEPIFEADFGANSFGFRPKRSAKDAMGKIKEYLKEKRTHVFDADLESYFDTIPHDKLMIAVKERIADGNVLALINQWLKCPVIDRNNKTSGGMKNQQGLPSKKSEKKVREGIKAILRTSLHLNPAGYVDKLNTRLRGWVNYFKIDEVSQMYTSVSRVAGYLGKTIYRMFRRKSHNGWGKHYRQYAYKKFIQEHGLINLYECINRKAL